VKRGRCAYHYVEVMACPSGCLNGGGQIKPGPGISPQQLVEQLELTYAHSVGRAAGVGAPAALSPGRREELPPPGQRIRGVVAGLRQFVKTEPGGKPAW
jgi:hypothetical protein